MFKKSLLGLAAISMFATTSAKADVITPYVGIYGHMVEAGYRDKARANGKTYNEKFRDTEEGISVAAGIKYSDFRTSLEYFQPSRFRDTGESGEEVRMSLKAVMLTQYYDFNNDSDFVPYIGAGISYGKMNFNYVRLGKKDESKLGWHVGAGVQYKMTDNWFLDLGYRYMDYGHVDNSIEHVHNRQHVKFNDLYLGVTYNFGGDEPKAEKKTVRKVVVSSAKKTKDRNLDPSNFGFNKSELSEERKNDLVNQLNEFKDDEDIVFDVYGYTDRIGPEEYNKTLSQKRADSVAKVLREKGFEKQVQNVEGRGPTNSVVGKECDAVEGISALSRCLAPDRRVEIEVKKK